MRNALCLAWLLLLVGCREPKAIIVGPQQVAPGLLFVLDGTQSFGEGHSWLAPDGVQTLTTNAGEKCGAAIGQPGRYRFALAVTAHGNVSLTTHDLVVSDTPLPGPSPTPAPTLPDGKFGLAKAAAGWASSINDPARSTSALSLAKSFRSIAAAIAAGAITSPADILSQTKKSNADALSAASPAWKPFGDSLAGRLEELYDSKAINSADDFRTAWLEIATGLEAVK